MSAGRRRQWLIAATALLAVLAVTLAWGAFLNARSTPRWEKTVPGGWADPLPEGGMPMRLASLTVTPVLVTDRGEQPAPAGALWAIAVIEYRPSEDGSYCSLILLAADGRRWSPVSPLDYSGKRALDYGCRGGAVPARGEQIYLIPEDAAGSLSGLAGVVTAYRGTAPHPLLAPPE